MTPLALASTAAPAPSHPFLDGGGAQRRLALWHGRVDGRSSAMNFTIDSAGRIVIPVQVRREAGLLPGVPLDIRVENGAVVIQPAATPVRLVRKGRFTVAVADGPMPALTGAAVEETQRRVRDERGDHGSPRR